jgi:putative membrane protein
VAHGRFHPAVRALIGFIAVLAAPLAHAHTPRADEAGATLQLVVGVLLAIACVLYVAGVRHVLAGSAAVAGVRRSAALFAAGWATLFAALVWPLAPFTEGLFSAHMVQHELMMVVAAPLLVLGRPLAMWTWALPARSRAAAARPLRSRAFARVWNRAASPLGATVLHAAAIWTWHVPRVFELSEASAAAHALQHVAFLATGVLFWWALLKPARGARVGAAVGCLFITMLHTGALGVLLTFSADVWYPAATAHAHAFGLTPLEDQQLGGLVMWVVGSLPYVVAALALAARWFTEPAPTRSRCVSRRASISPIKTRLDQVRGRSKGGDSCATRKSKAIAAPRSFCTG